MIKCMGKFVSLQEYDSVLDVVGLAPLLMLNKATR